MGKQMTCDYTADRDSYAKTQVKVTGKVDLKIFSCAMYCVLEQ